MLYKFKLINSINIIRVKCKVKKGDLVQEGDSCINIIRVKCKGRHISNIK